MENITTGHWIFAGVFMILFIGFLIWSYRKDKPIHKVHYSGSTYILISILLILFLIFIFKRLL